MQKYMQKLSLRPDYAGKLDTLIRYGIAAILIAVPLYPKFPFLTVPGTYVSIRIEDFLILIVAVLWGIRILPNIKKLWENNVIRSIVIFLVVTLFSTLVGIYFLHTVVPLVGILQWGRRVEYLLGFVIGVSSVKSKEDVQFYVKCIGIVLILVFVVGILQKYFGFPVITTQNDEYSKGIALRFVQGGHLASTFAGHYDMATYILMTSPILISIFFMTKKSLRNFMNINEKVTKGIILFIIVTSFWLMVNAASRISAVSYVISMSTALFLIRKYKYIPVIVIISVIFIFSTSSLFNRYLNIFDVLKNKITLIPTAYAQTVDAPAPMAVLEDRSTNIRLNVEWPRAVRAFLKNPLLGTGFSSITLATDNDYLRILGEAGILGAVTMFFVFFRIAKKYLQKIPLPKDLPDGKAGISFEDAYLAGIIGAILGVLLNAVFIDVFEASKFAMSFWFLLGFSIALIARQHSYDKKTTE